MASEANHKQYKCLALNSRGEPFEIENDFWEIRITEIPAATIIIRNYENHLIIRLSIVYVFEMQMNKRAWFRFIFFILGE